MFPWSDSVFSLRSPGSYTSSHAMILRHCCTRPYSVRRRLLLKRLGCRSSTPSSTDIAFNLPRRSPRNIGTFSCSQTPATASGCGRQLRLFLCSDGSGPLCHLLCAISQGNWHQNELVAHRTPGTATIVYRCCAEIVSPTPTSSIKEQG